MKHDMEEKMIKDALSRIQTPAYDITLEVKKRIDKPKPRISFKKSILLSVVICLSLIFSIGVTAANIPIVNNLLAIVRPDTAEILQPIGVSSEDEGIKMEVTAAMNDDEMAVIYVTLQDLISDRIDESLDLYDYTLSDAQMLNSQIVHYDEATKTATLRIQGNGGKVLNGKKVSFGINSFLSQKKIFDEVETGIDPLDIKTMDASQKIPLDMNKVSGGGGNLYPVLKAQGKINVLKTDQLNKSLPKIDFIHISNMGYVDGFLHIQTKWTGEGVDDHGYFYFADTLGNRIDMDSMNVYFGTDEFGNAQYGREYIEYIFDTANINLNEAKLRGYFVTSGKYTKGNWKTTFVFQSVREEKKKECLIELDTWTAYSVSISPLGITLTGSGEESNQEEIKVCATMSDGSVKTFDSVRSYRDDKEIRLKFTADLPLEVSMVECVSINGRVIRFD